MAKDRINSKKGYYFTIDVIFAMFIFVAGAILVINSYLSSQIVLPTTTTARDIGDFLSTSSLEKLNLTDNYPITIKNATDSGITNFYLKITDLCAIYYNKSQNNHINDTLTEIVNKLVSDNRNVEIRINNNIVMRKNTTAIENSNQVSVDKRLLFFGNYKEIYGPYPITIIVWV